MSCSLLTQQQPWEQIRCWLEFIFWINIDAEHIFSQNNNWIQWKCNWMIPLHSLFVFSSQFAWVCGTTHVKYYHGTQVAIKVIKFEFWLLALSNQFKRKFTAQNIFKLTTWQILQPRFVSLWIKLWVTKVG